MKKQKIQEKREEKEESQANILRQRKRGFQLHTAGLTKSEPISAYKQKKKLNRIKRGI